MNIFSKTSIITLLYLLLLGSSPSYAILFDFEDLPDMLPVGNFYASYGIHFGNSLSLTAGFSLNEIDYPPSSGLVAIGDDNAPIEITFDEDVYNLFGNFTYASQLTFSAYDASNSLISTFVNSGLSNLGSSELITLGFTGVRSLVITGEWNNSYILDDFNFDPVPAAPVPEPTSILLLGTGLLFGVRLLRKEVK